MPITESQRKLHDENVEFLWKWGQEWQTTIPVPTFEEFKAGFDRKIEVFGPLNLQQCIEWFKDNPEGSNNGYQQSIEKATSEGNLVDAYNNSVLHAFCSLRAATDVFIGTENEVRWEPNSNELRFLESVSTFSGYSLFKGDTAITLAGIEVDLNKFPIDGSTPEQRKVLAEFLWELNDTVKLLDFYAKQVRSNREQIAKRLGAIMESQDLPKMTQKMTDGTNVNFKTETKDQISIDKTQEEDALLFLIANGLGEIIKDQVHPATLNSQLNRLLRSWEGSDDEEDNVAPEDDDTENEDRDEENDDLLGGELPFQNVQAEEFCLERIARYTNMVRKLRTVPRNVTGLPTVFKRFTVTRAKITAAKK